MRATRRSVVLGIAFSFGSALLAAPPALRPAGDFTVVDTSGKKVSVAESVGQVVLMQFLYTTCPHCQASARVFSKLQRELGPRGLRVIGVAFNEEVEGHPEVIRNFVQSNRLEFPVGVATRDAVVGYLGISVLSRFMVPQVLVIDRDGMIRAQSDPLGSPELMDETKVRALLESLLQEHKTGRTSRATSTKR